MLLFLLGVLLDAVLAVFIPLDFSLNQPVIMTMFAFNFWVLASLRIEAKYKWLYLFYVILVFEMIHVDTYWIYGFTLFLMYYVLQFFTKVLHQSYLEQFTLLNLMSFCWLLMMYAYIKIFSLSNISFWKFFSVNLFLSAIVQLLIATLSLVIIMYFDRFQLKRDMEKRNREYVSYRGQS